MKILEVNNLSKNFSLEQSLLLKLKNVFSKDKRDIPALKALDEVSFFVNEGEILGVLGESGSGKSTLAKAIMGIVKPDIGEIMLFGKNILGLSGNKRLEVMRSMQMIFQDPFSSLDPRMNVRQILLEPLKIHKLVPNNIDEFLTKQLEDVGLDSFALNCYPSEFSGGQRQRIGICRALILNPKLIIADEAVSALDVSIQAQILELLLKLQKTRNLSIIFISHDVAVVRQISHRIILLYKGRLVETIEADKLLVEAKHEYTKKLINAALYLRENRHLSFTRKK